jgi:hypothetical protein
MNIPIPDYSDVFTLAEFVEMCKDGSVINYDGTGYYSDGKVFNRDNEIYPDDIRNGKEPDINFTHVVWFNK